MREWTRITVHQAAQKLGISDQAVRVQMQSGDLKIGKIMRGDRGHNTYIIYEELVDKVIECLPINDTELQTENFTAEARVFKDGRVVTRVRPVEPEDKQGYKETQFCIIITDLFETAEEASEFLSQYKIENYEKGGEKG